MSLPVLVLGATGLLGQVVTRQLLARGADVVAPVRPGRRLPPDLSPHVTSPVAASVDDLVDVLVEARPHAVVDAAWSGVAGRSRLDAFQQAENVDRVGRLLEHVDADVTRCWVGLGSQAEYGPIDGLVDEDHPTAPDTPYGRAKLEVLDRVESVLSARGVRSAWLRVFATYGPGQQPGWLVRDALERMLLGEPVPLSSGRQGCDYAYVDDVGAAVVAVLGTDAASGVFNVGTGQSTTVADLVERARAVAGSSSPLLFGAVPDPPGPVRHWAADARRLHAVTGWSAGTSLEDGLARTLRWLRDHELVPPSRER